VECTAWLEELSVAHGDVLDGPEYRISVIDLGSGRGTYHRLKGRTVRRHQGRAPGVQRHKGA